MNEFGQRFIGVTIVDIPDEEKIKVIDKALDLEMGNMEGFNYPCNLILKKDGWSISDNKDDIEGKEITYENFLSLLSHEEKRIENEAPLRDFETDVRIDRFALDIECEQHPSKYLYWSQILANKKHELDKAKGKLHLIESEANLRYRKEPKDDIKVTESTINAMLDTDPGVIKVKEEIAKIGHEFSIISSVVNALEHKRSELNNLVQLQLAGYYSGIKTSSTDNIADEVKTNLNKDKEENNG
jgi:hypothetical protein